MVRASPESTIGLVGGFRWRGGGYLQFTAHLQWNRQGNKRGLTINQFAMFVIGISMLMLTTAVVLDLDDTGADEFADSELESVFAPAAGGNDHSNEAKNPRGVSWLRRLRERY